MFTGGPWGIGAGRPGANSIARCPALRCRRRMLGSKAARRIWSMIRTARGQSERGGPAFRLDRSLEDAKQPACSVEPIKHLSPAVSGPQFRTASKKRGGLGRRDRKARARRQAEVSRGTSKRIPMLGRRRGPFDLPRRPSRSAGVRVEARRTKALARVAGAQPQKIAPAISRLVYHVGSISPRACWFDRLKQKGLDI